MIRSGGVAIALLVVCACGPEPDNDSPDDASAEAVGTGSEADDVARFTIEDFQVLRYLEGDWRGSGYEGGPFYETYRFVNDSTIEMTAWVDSTMAMPRDQSQYVFRNGVISTDEGARLVRVDEDGHHFEAESYGWTFRQVSADRWTARVGPSTVYTMDRLTRR